MLRDPSPDDISRGGPSWRDREERAGQADR